MTVNLGDMLQETISTAPRRPPLPKRENRTFLRESVPTYPQKWFPPANTVRRGEPPRGGEALGIVAETGLPFIFQGQVEVDVAALENGLPPKLKPAQPLKLTLTRRNGPKGSVTRYPAQTNAKIMSVCRR